MFLEDCIKLQFPQEGIAALQNALIKIEATANTASLLKRACQGLTTPQQTDPLQLMQKISQLTGIHPYTVSMVAFISGISHLKKAYREKGLAEQLMWDSLMDLNYKLMECKKVYNIWGTAAAAWHTRFYTLQLFKLGRLEYEMIPYRWDTPYGNIRTGAPVVNVHIPSCGSLTTDAVLDSLQKAYCFYKPHFPAGTVPFVCSSWMLYPPLHEAVFPEDSNLRRFYACFDVLEQKADPLNKDFWRIFDCEFSPETLQAIVPKTALQRKLLTYLQSGGCMGLGKGAFVFDGYNMKHL